MRLPPFDSVWRLRLAALTAAAVAVLIRIPFAARRMWDHDSIQFALGVERYDLAAHHPHPPGYPLYIALLKLLRLAGVEPLQGMVALAILAGGLGAAAILLLATRLSGGRLAVGMFAAALFATDPLLWFYGELPLLYAVEGGLTVVIAAVVLRMGEGRAAFYGAVALFALVGGLRQSSMVLLAPLFLYGVWRAWRDGRLPLPRIALGAALGLGLVLAWFVPLCLQAGGYAEYKRIGAEHFRTLLPATSILYGAGWGALEHNLEVLTKWTLQGILPGVLALLGLFVVSVGLAPRRWGEPFTAIRAHAVPLAFWALPPLAFFALFHVTKAGYTLVYLPAFLTALALAAGPLFERGDGAAARSPFGWRPLLATATAVACGAGIFLFGADRSPEEPRLFAVAKHEFRAAAIREYEEELDRTLDTLHRYPPGSTVLVTVELSGTGSAGAEGFLYPWQRHLQWYLPEYLVVHAVPEQDLAFVARGHEPFHEELSQLWVPARTTRLIYVLSGWPGNRLPLGPGAVAGKGKWFTLAVVPFRGSARIGSLVVTAEKVRLAA
ncbi:MAG TPA: hypothetical protein VN851_03930 [Thermoanaerobaculia bacterium]|nr:hypothetical protein [Thermoanaerobaculia bacterium]